MLPIVGAVFGGGLLSLCLLAVCLICKVRRRGNDTRGRALLSGQHTCEVQRSRVLEAQFYLRSSAEYRLEMLLPQIGTLR